MHAFEGGLHLFADWWMADQPTSARVSQDNERRLGIGEPSYFTNHVHQHRVEAQPVGE